MKVVKFMNIIKKIYRIILKKRNPVAYARLLGVNMRGKVTIYGNVTWSTEPWIISLGNNVHITTGVKFITHDGGTLLLHMISQTIP